MTVSVAWEQLIFSVTSTKMDYWKGNVLEQLFPHPSGHHWFPSWTQVQQYPDVSVRDNDPVLVSGGVDCSLHIMSGRIYDDCLLHIIQPPTPEKKAVYSCTKGGKDAQLVATVSSILTQEASMLWLILAQTLAYGTGYRAETRRNGSTKRLT